MKSVIENRLHLETPLVPSPDGASSSAGGEIEMVKVDVLLTYSAVFEEN